MSRLQHVYWIGGGSGAGKSTVARRLAERHSFEVYSTDATIADHVLRTPPGDGPLLHGFLAMDLDERWLHRSPREMCETFHWFQGEGFHLIIEDLLKLPSEPRVIVEGFRLLPRRVLPLLEPGHGIWLLPTPEFRRMAFERRGTLMDIPRKTSYPERALAKLLERDRLFTDVLRTEAAEVGVPSIDVGTSLSEDALVAQVERRLGLAR